VEHDYSQGLVVDCLVYYLTGYLVKQISKHTKCTICLTAINSSESFSVIPEAQFTNLISNGGLIHPNVKYLLSLGK